MGVIMVYKPTYIWGPHPVTLLVNSLFCCFSCIRKGFLVATRREIKIIYIHLPSGKHTKFAIENGSEIVDIPIEHGDVPSFFLCLPGKVLTLPYPSIIINQFLPLVALFSLERIESWLYKIGLELHWN